MKKDFVVERNGRAFCLFAGLLDLAHSQGLKSIVTSLVQIPCPENGNVAICQATVVIEQNGVERVFTGIGDASPNNVAPAMQTCLLRMSETRAKARALRDAVNIGVAAFEELGDEGEPQAYPARPSTRPAGPLRSSSSPVAGKCPECGTQGKFHRPGCSKAQAAA